MKSADRQDDVEKARQDQQRRVQEHLDRQPAVDDQVDQPQRLRQPDRGAQRRRHEQHHAQRLPQNVAIEPGHRARIIGTRQPRHRFPPPVQAAPQDAAPIDDGIVVGALYRARSFPTARPFPHEDRFRRLRRCPKTGAVVVRRRETRVLTAPCRRLDEETGGAPSQRRSRRRRAFTARRTSCCRSLAPANVPVEPHRLAGLGKSDGIDATRFAGSRRQARRASERRRRERGDGADRPGDADGFEADEAAAQLAFGARLRALPLRQVPHQGEARAEAVARRRSPIAVDERRRREEALAALDARRRRRQLHPRPGLRAGQRDLSRRRSPSRRATLADARRRGRGARRGPR